ncbi:MAG: hypothetical protein JJT76_07730 [Clostridiaceae bacterium]|nr:hypothetical protein [Clostridiaceae bacterium]
MKEKLIGTFLFIFLALLSFHVYNFFDSPKSIATFQSYSSPSHKINKDLIDAYNSEDTSVKGEAKREIIEKALTAVGYEKWKEFKEYIELHLYEDQVLPQSSQQLIVALNLSKDSAFIAVFDKVGDEYIYYDKLPSLVPVNKIDFLSITPHPQKIMAVYQTLDERFGGFFYEDFLDLYLYTEEGFKKTWQKSLYYEEIYKEVWVDPDAKDSLWNRITEETLIDIIGDDPMRINTLTTLKKFSTNAHQYPELDSFSLIHTDNYKRSYYWSEDYDTFILGEVSKDVFLSNVALLDDMEISREALFGITNINYKLVTSNGEIIYLPKNKFQAMFQSLLEK